MTDGTEVGLTDTPARLADPQPDVGVTDTYATVMPRRRRLASQEREYTWADYLAMAFYGRPWRFTRDLGAQIAHRCEERHDRR